MAALHNEIIEATRVELADDASRRNDSLPVHKIPPDVLQYLARFFTFRERALATAVCRYWRKHIVADERLWRDPVLYWEVYGRSHMAAKFLERANSKIDTLTIQSNAREHPQLP